MHPLSPHGQPCREAEASLPDAADRPNSGLNEPSNLPATASESNLEKENTKTLIAISLIESPSLQLLLKDALFEIEMQDFFRATHILLRLMYDILRSQYYASINGLLATVNYLFIKLRYAFKTNDLPVDLKSYVDNFAKPLLGVFKQTATLIDEVMAAYNEAAKVMASVSANDVDQLMASESANGPILKLYIESQALCCSIFYSLNFQEVPQFFKDHMCEWMVEFKKYLMYKYPALEDYGDDVLDELRASVCKNISLYVIKEDELFQQGYLSGFVDDVLSLLVSYSSLGRDQLTIAAIEFLTRVSKSDNHTLLSRCDILQQICQSIVIPSVILQDEEEELFHTDPLQFIKRDMEENGDINIRRGIACELLKGIAVHYKDTVSEKVRDQIVCCVHVYTFNITRLWKYNDCIVRLVLSLATKNAGETSASTDLVNVDHFYMSYTAPAFQMSDVAAFPMLKAVALKFLILFRNQIFKKCVLQTLPDLTRLLASPDSVVRSYAAICIDKLLLVKDDGDRARYTSEDIRPILQTMMKNLFGVLDYPGSEENQYVMKCIMRVVLVGDLTPAVASLCIEKLTHIVHEACGIRKSPLFCHYLFESLTPLIRRVCVLSRQNIRKLRKVISLVSRLEKKLYPCLQKISADDIIEYFPYAFGLLAELVKLNRPLFNQLHNKWRTAEFAKNLIMFMSRFLVKHGSQNLVDSVNAVQPNAFQDVLEECWIPGLKLITTSPIELNLACVASTRLICESLDTLDIKLWGKMLDSIVTLISRPEHQAWEPEIPDNASTCAQKKAEGFSPPKKKQKTGEEDPLKGIKDPREFLVLSLSNLLAAPRQGREYHQVIGGSLEEANKSALVQLFNQYNYPVPSLCGLISKLAPFSLSSSLKHMSFRLSGAEIARREREDRIRKRQLSDDHTNYVSHSSITNEAAFQQKIHGSSKHVPAGWLGCPDSGQEIGYIIPSKVPIDDTFNGEVLPGHRYSFTQVTHHLRAQSNKKLGLVIDLTNTDRYYSKTDLQKESIKHVKIACRGRDSVPDNESVNRFVYEVSEFLAKQKEPKKYVLVHCTHGHNRTGYMIVHYLMRTEPILTVAQALRRFADARPPGIYKPDYIDALYSFYHEKKPDMFAYPPIPEWKDDDDDGDSESSLPKGHEETEAVMKNDDILGDGIPSDQQDELRRLCYSALGLTGKVRGCTQFPGSHPVPLNSVNVEYLRQHNYCATWKADGTRYMMLITMGGCYLIDRHFNFRRVQMRFPCKQTNGGLAERTYDFTLLDGEMVCDTVPGSPGSQKQERRYLIYDMMALNTGSLVREPFHDRWKKIWEEIIEPRNHERQQIQIHQSSNPYQYELEPFEVRRKDFWPLSTVPKFLKEFIPNLSHAAGCLVFQGWDDRYVPRTHEGLLKWKYAKMNSVDFLFEVKGHHHKLYLHERGKRKLLVGEVVKFQDGSDPLPFSGKIIECSWDSNKKCWEFMRIRPDKGTPNDINTYQKVRKSIKDNITDKILSRKIEETIRLQEMFAE